MPAEAPTLLVFWESVVDDLLARTARFPRSVRFSLSGRMVGGWLRQQQGT
jgi:hypothetical protein